MSDAPYEASTFWNPSMEMHTDAWGRTVENDDEEVAEQPSGKYDALSGQELAAEFNARNEAREEAGQEPLTVERRTKAAFRAALEADDAEEE